MDTEIFKPILAGMVRHGLTTVGGALVTDGVLQSSDVNGFIGAGMVLAGAGWSWYQKVGQAEIAALLKKVTSKATVAGAVDAAKKAVIAFLIVASSLLAMPGSEARAGDIASPAATPIATKAPSAWLDGYPYGSSGPYVGLVTQAGGGSVVANIPGIASASLTTTSASVGGLAGYAWGSKSSSLAYAVELGAGATNFNGANAGFALAGPAYFEGTALIWMPVSAIQSAFTSLNIPNPFSAIAPFPLTPNLTATNVQAGFGAGFYAQDLTLAYQGVGTNKVWSFAPKIEFDLMEQLSNASALREFVKVDFPTKGILFGSKQSTATPGTEIRAGAAYLF